MRVDFSAASEKLSWRKWSKNRVPISFLESSAYALRRNILAAKVGHVRIVESLGNWRRIVYAATLTLANDRVVNRKYPGSMVKFTGPHLPQAKFKK